MSMDSGLLAQSLRSWFTESIHIIGLQETKADLRKLKKHTVTLKAGKPLLALVKGYSGTAALQSMP